MRSLTGRPAKASPRRAGDLGDISEAPDGVDVSPADAEIGAILAEPAGPREPFAEDLGAEARPRYRRDIIAEISPRYCREFGRARAIHVAQWRSSRVHVSQVGIEQLVDWRPSDPARLIRAIREIGASPLHIHLSVLVRGVRQPGGVYSAAGQLDSSSPGASIIRE